MDVLVGVFGRLKNLFYFAEHLRCVSYLIFYKVLFDYFSIFNKTIFLSVHKHYKSYFVSIYSNKGKCYQNKAIFFVCDVKIFKRFLPIRAAFELFKKKYFSHIYIINFNNLAKSNGTK